ncbi:hypothetical protein C8046_13895 [Serinibacter arcticus]|uniref:Uncharacterized protein n=1 Tax=Serinibacter arcticus TaxID=1655435 RepID=A0A2U1ZX97_9MICO|nr:Ig-like domain-containing protein [Serinibacter arcticus]PWD51570.1 hypothetical protein C8046_13895 [Serinibacter arcticus]
MPRFTRWLAAVALLAVGVLVPTGSAPTAVAAPGQLGAPQVVLNPAGGTSGDNGIRLTLNSVNSGGDELLYRGQQQYYGPSDFNPSLAIGDRTFSQAGFGRYSIPSPSWTSLEVVRTTGSAAAGGTGSASATLRYTAVVDGLSYVMERLVSYTYPNTFVTETYAFTIPEGNTKNLRFYHGGDTTPGGTDVGYGLMITQPSRTVVSLNQESGVQVALRERPDSKPFDGAVSGGYSIPYAPMRTGQPIGFRADTAFHDAGLMVEWNLGSTPGTQTYSLDQVATLQGANLTATFGQTFTVAGAPVSLDLAVNNSFLEGRAGIGYTVALPAGVRVAGAPTRAPACAGTVSATIGGSTITTSGGSVAATSTCLLQVPVTADAVGTYTLTAASVTAVTGATNTVGTTSFFVPLAPAITTEQLPTMTAGVAYSATVAADGAPAPEWAVTGGALPEGLRLDAVSGAITGTPTASGPWSVQLTATNVGGTDVRAYAGVVTARTAPLVLAFDPTVVSYGQASTVAVQGVPAGATGTVAISLDGAELCTVTLPATSCTTSAALEPGTHAAVGSYSGDAVWAPATFTGPVLVVTRAEAALTAALSASTITYGETASVVVSAAPGATGEVRITSGDRTLCTITLPTATSCTTPVLAAGAYTLAATYAGDGRFAPGAAQAGTLTVQRVVAEPGPVELTGVYGTPVTVTLPDLPAGATGDVVVQLDGEVLCTYAVDGGTGPGCVVPADTSAGSHELTLAYSGDANHEGATVEGSVEIARAASTLELPDDVAGVFGVATPVTVGLAPSTATGDVTLSLGEAELCSAAPGSPCVLPADLAAGTHEVLASYAGDANHEPTTGVVTVVIARAGTDLVGEVTATTVGTPATVTVSGLPDAATGLVTVSNPDLGTLCTIDVAETASCVTDGTTAAGTWALTLDYAGDANHEPSTATASLVVERNATSFTAQATGTDVYGTTVITVAGLPADATGTVVVTADGLGTICTIALDADSCESAVLATAGTVALALDYSGDTTYLPSSATAELVVAPLTTALTAQVEPVTVGDTAVVTIAGLPETANGVVTVSSPELGELCSIDLGEALTCETGAMASVGSFLLDVAYPGDVNHEASATTVELWVVPIVTSISVPEVLTGVEGEPVVVEVSGLPETATGVVQVRNGALPPVEDEQDEDGAVEDGAVTLLALVPAEGEVLCSYDVSEASACTLPLDLVAGEYDLLVTYLGDVAHDGAQASTTLVLAPAPVPPVEEPSETPAPTSPAPTSPAPTSPAPTSPAPTASATPPAQSPLPVTGAGLLGAAGAALALLVVGGTVLVVRRRTV